MRNQGLQGIHIVAGLEYACVVSALWFAPWPSALVSLAAGQGPSVAANAAPTAEQIHSLIMRAIENQHRNDRELQEFERVERIVTRKVGKRRACSPT